MSLTQLCGAPPDLKFRDEKQKELYSKVKEFVNNDKETLLVTGPPGSGKTFITVHSLLDNFDGKIIVILRTHNQQDHYAKLFDSFLPIRGIEFYCQVPQVKLHPLKNQLCRWLRLGKYSTCVGCQYRMQFLNIPKYKIISFLYSHSIELIKSILEHLEEKYILVFDEFQHCLPREQVIPSHFVQLASAEYGKEINLNQSISESEIQQMKKVGEENWKRVGYSYLLALTETIEWLRKKGRWFYRVDNGYAYLDDSIYSLINDKKVKKVFVSATPLPEVSELGIQYHDKFHMNYELNTVFVIYIGFKFNFKTRSDPKTTKHIRKLIYALSKYRSIIFFPSNSALKSVLPKLPINFTTEPTEYPMKNTLLIAGGKWSEGIDLPTPPEVLVVVGVPYDDPLPKNPYLRELFRYFKLYNVKVRRVLYDYKAILKVIQSFGRGIRNIQRKLLIILADKRYTNEKMFELFPEWLKNNVHKFVTIDNLEILDKFIARWNLDLRPVEWLEEVQREKDFELLQRRSLH